MPGAAGPGGGGFDAGAALYGDYTGEGAADFDGAAGGGFGAGGECEGVAQRGTFKLKATGSAGSTPSPRRTLITPCPG